MFNNQTPDQFDVNQQYFNPLEAEKNQQFLGNLHTGASNNANSSHKTLFGNYLTKDYI